MLQDQKTRVRIFGRIGLAPFCPHFTRPDQASAFIVHYRRYIASIQLKFIPCLLIGLINISGKFQEVNHNKYGVWQRQTYQMGSFYDLTLMAICTAGEGIFERRIHCNVLVPFKTIYIHFGNVISWFGAVGSRKEGENYLAESGQRHLAASR